MADPSQVQQQMASLSMQGNTPAAHYPAVPFPAANPAAPGYPATMGVPNAQYPPGPPANGHAAAANGAVQAGPVSMGEGWTPEAVKPEHAKPGQSAGHYGHLQ